MSDCPDCGGSCGIPADAVILNELRIVECMDESGEIWKIDMSCGADGNDLAVSKQLELCEWGRMLATAPILADMVESYRGA